MNAATANGLKVGGAVVVLIAAAVLFARSFGNNPQERETKTIYGVSLATGKEYTLEVPALSAPPYEEPGTGERCVYPWYYSKDVDKRFVPKLEAQADGPPKVPMIPLCPETGSMNVTGWDPELHIELDRESKGDMQLPEWPMK